MSRAVDVVIVNFNTRADLEACLESLRTAAPGRLGRVFVVDNASTDGSAEAVRTHRPDVALLALDENVGFAAANNKALAAPAVSIAPPSRSLAVPQQLHCQRVRPLATPFIRRLRADESFRQDIARFDVHRLDNRFGKTKVTPVGRITQLLRVPILPC